MTFAVISRLQNWSATYKVYIILFILIALGFLLRLPPLVYNLPVAAGVDERTGMRLFYRFENGSLDPKFFDWPTFYYYLTYFVTKPFTNDFQTIILYGRIVNMLLGCLLAILAFLFAKFSLRSSEVGLIASFFVAYSPTLIQSGSYINTDTLLTVLSLLAILLFTLFFTNRNYRYWFVGVLIAGLAISTKYTALLIVPTYVIFEFFFSENSTDSKRSDNLFERRFSIRWLSVGFIVIGILCLALYFALSSTSVQYFFQRQGDMNASLDPADIGFVEGWRIKFLVLSVFLFIAFLLSLYFRTFFLRFCYLRPYLGAALILLFFVLGSPFTLISWQGFIYQFGSVLKLNELASSERQWLRFFSPYFNHESIIVLIFFLIGVYWLAKHKKPFAFLAMYLMIYYIYHGSATRVFARYWTPILPEVFIISAYGVYFTASLFKRLRWERAGFTLIVVTFVGLELLPKYCSFVFEPIQTTDSMYASYHWILEEEPSRIYYSPFIPDVELKVSGFDLKEAPRSWITTDVSSLLQQMGPGDVLLIDGHLEPQMNAVLRQNLSLEWSSRKDYGQYVYRKVIKP